MADYTPDLNMVLRILLRVIAHRLQSNSPGVEKVNKATLHIGAVAFIHRLGSSQAVSPNNYQNDYLQLN